MIIKLLDFEMDFVVILAIFLLFVVFVFAGLVLICMCCRRKKYSKFVEDDQPLRFSKLRQDNVDDIIQLSPHISQTLNSNQWIYDISGILEHCVAVMKLCHTLTDKLAKIPLTSISPQLNDVICQATARVVPRFDDLLQSMAAPNVDVKLIEARVVALVTTCFSLVSPFYLMNPKYKEVFGQLIRDMEIHQQFLQQAVDQAALNAVASVATAAAANGTPTAPAAAATPTPTAKASIEQQKTVVDETEAPTTKPPPPATTPVRKTPSEQSKSAPMKPLSVSTTARTPPASYHQAPIVRQERSASVTLNSRRDEARQELLGDHEAPADPSA